MQFGACLRQVALALRPGMTSAQPKLPNVVHIEVLGPWPAPARAGRPRAGVPDGGQPAAWAPMTDWA